MARKLKKQNRGQIRRSTRSSRGRSLGAGGPAGAAIGQPFPTVPPHLQGKVGVVTSVGIPGPTRAPPTQPTLRTRPSDSIIKGGTSSEKRAVGIAESALGEVGTSSRGRKSQSQQLEKFCEVKIVKGKRKRVCKTRVKVKTKKTKTKKKRKPALRGFFN